MTRNPGHCPPEAVGKRVRARLRNGQVAQSWPADGHRGCRWTLIGHPFDILSYEVLG